MGDGYKLTKTPHLSLIHYSTCMKFFTNPAQNMDNYQDLNNVTDFQDDEDAGMDSLSHLSKHYRGPLAWEIQRARANRQGFQNTMNTTMETNKILSKIYDPEARQKFLNSVMMFLFVNNGKKGMMNLNKASNDFGKMTIYEFNEFTKILVTCFVNFKMADALLQKVIESLQLIEDVFVLKRECLCFLFGQEKVCADCKNTIYGKVREIDW